MVVAIDGPGGVGKSTVAQRLAAACGMDYLDTGATYRAATIAVLDAGVPLTDVAEVAKVVAEAIIEYEDGSVFLNGEDVSAAARTDEVTAAVSAVAAVGEVRTRLVEIQRMWVDERDGAAVVDGRDIGTVVFPDAPTKIYLTAHPEVRAQRRARDQESGDTVAGVQADLARRDEADSSREVAPLRPADDSAVIDTSDMTVDEVVAAVLALVGPDRHVS